MDRCIRLENLNIWLWCLLCIRCGGVEVDPTVEADCASLRFQVETKCGDKHYCCRLRHVETHQLIRTSDNLFEPIIGWLHCDPHVDTAFVEIAFLSTSENPAVNSTAPSARLTQEVLSLTPEHLLFVKTADGPKSVRAADVRQGDLIYVAVRTEEAVTINLLVLQLTTSVLFRSERYERARGFAFDFLCVILATHRSPSAPRSRWNRRTLCVLGAYLC